MTDKKIKSGTIDVKALLPGDEEFLCAGADSAAGRRVGKVILTGACTAGTGLPQAKAEANKSMQLTGPACWLSEFAVSRAAPAAERGRSAGDYRWQAGMGVWGANQIR